MVDDRAAEPTATKVDFWLLTRDPVEKVTAMIAERVLRDGARLLVMHGDPDARQNLSRALWEHGGTSFLANGEAQAPHAERQPILIGDACTAANGARQLVLADGEWREEALGFDRAFLLFGEDRREAARGVWKALEQRGNVERSYYAQEGGRWVKKG